MDSALRVPEAKDPVGPEETGLLAAVHKAPILKLSNFKVLSNEPGRRDIKMVKMGSLPSSSSLIIKKNRYSYKNLKVDCQGLLFH